MAKRDDKGNLVISSQSLKNLYLKTYQLCLSPPTIRGDNLYIFKLKKDLWEKQNKNLRNIIGQPWTEENLDISLKRLKNKKTRDPHGLINEIFKEGFIGDDLKRSLLLLMNEVKENIEIPDFFTISNITSLYKRSGSRQDMNNERGIFVQTTFKKILSKLIYEEYYPEIDNNMTDANIGGRKERMVQDHLFVVNGIINSVVNGNEDPIDVVIYDIEKAFDKLWIEESFNDLFDNLPESMRNDKVSVLFEANKKAEVAIKTPSGMTERITVEKVIQQGGSWGPILCSNSTDTLGKKSLTEDKSLYIYKKSTKIPLLLFIDDIFSVSKCGIEALEKNVTITSQIEMKRLNFNVGSEQKKSKCVKLHVGSKFIFCPNLKANGKNLEHTNEITYLGNILCGNASNGKNIKNRVSKGIGYISQIFTILDNVCFGEHFFEMALLLRESLLINAVLFTSEIWYNLNQKDIQDLEYLDKVFFCRLMGTPKTIQTEAYYLEFGTFNVEVYIKSRRILYYHNLVNRDKTQLVYSFFMTQYVKRTNGDVINYAL